MRGSGIIPSKLLLDHAQADITPDVISVDYVRKDATTTGEFTTASGGTRNFEIILDAEDVVDPSSIVLYFTGTVGGTGNSGAATACCTNFAHSFFRRITLRFSGSGSGVIEEIEFYNIFCSMLYQFEDPNYLRIVMGAIGGFYPAFDTVGAAISNAEENRQWSGKAFAIPLELGFFTSLKSYLPMFVLPPIQISVQMEAVESIVMSSDLTNAIDTSIVAKIANPKLYYKKIVVSEAYKDAVRQKLTERANAGNPYVLQYRAWTATTQSILLASGTNTYNLAASTRALQRAIFGMVLDANAADLTVDGINTFSRNVLSSYRWVHGSRKVPNDPVVIGSTTSDTGENGDMSLALYHNFVTSGVFDRDMYGRHFRASNQTAFTSIDPDSLTTAVFQYDFSHSPSSVSFLYGTMATNALSLELTFASTPSAAKLYIFMEEIRGVVLSAPGRVTLE